MVEAIKTMDPVKIAGVTCCSSSSPNNNKKKSSPRRKGRVGRTNSLDSALEFRFFGGATVSPFQPRKKKLNLSGGALKRLTIKSLLGSSSTVELDDDDEEEDDYYSSENEQLSRVPLSFKSIKMIKALALKRIHKKIQDLTEQELDLQKKIKIHLERAKARHVSQNERGAILSMRNIVKLEEEQARHLSAIGYLRTLELTKDNDEQDPVVVRQYQQQQEGGQHDHQQQELDPVLDPTTTPGSSRDESAQNLYLYENFESEVHRILESKTVISTDGNSHRSSSYSGANSSMSDDQLLDCLAKLMVPDEQAYLDLSRHSSISSIGLCVEEDLFGDAEDDSQSDQDDNSNSDHSCRNYDREDNDESSFA